MADGQGSAVWGIAHSRVVLKVLFMNSPPESNNDSSWKSNAATTGGFDLDEEVEAIGSSADTRRIIRPRLRSSGPAIAMPGKERATWFGALIVAMMLIIDSGVPALLVGMPAFTVGRVVSAALIAVGLLIPQFGRNRNFAIGNIICLMPAILFCLIVIVSFISNILIFKYELNNFAPSLYMLFPVLTFYFLRNLSISSGDVIYGIIISSIFATIIVIIDIAFGIPSLMQMRRLSVFGEAGNTNRLVVLKDACVMSFVIIVAIILARNKSLMSNFFYVILFSIVSIPILFTFESRFAILVSILSTGLFVAFGRMTISRRVTYYSLGMVAGIPGAWLVLQKFITPMLGADWETYAEANNVSVRINSLDYYFRWYERGDYFGIGHMSTSPNYDNILSSVVDNAFNLNDLGIYASLLQFGPAGLIVVSFMTIYLIVGLLRFRRSSHYHAPELYILGFYVFASLMQVCLPTSSR